MMSTNSAANSESGSTAALAQAAPVAEAAYQHYSCLQQPAQQQQQPIDQQLRMTAGLLGSSPANGTTADMNVMSSVAMGSGNNSMSSSTGQLHLSGLCDEKTVEYLRDLIAEKHSLVEMIANKEHQAQFLNEPQSLQQKKMEIVLRLLDQEICRIQGGGKPPGKDNKFVDIYHEKPIRLSAKVLVPVKEHPKFNFVGKLLGPKGNSMKRLQEDTITKMAVLGRGSMRNKQQEEDLRGSTDPKYSHLHDDLHVEITAFAAPAEAYARLARALAEVRKYLIPDSNDEIRQLQMREMQKMNKSTDCGGIASFPSTTAASILSGKLPTLNNSNATLKTLLMNLAATTGNGSGSNFWNIESLTDCSNANQNTMNRLLDFEDGNKNIEDQEEEPFNLQAENVRVLSVLEQIQRSLMKRNSKGVKVHEMATENGGANDSSSSQSNSSGSPKNNFEVDFMGKGVNLTELEKSAKDMVPKTLETASNSGSNPQIRGHQVGIGQTASRSRMRTHLTPYSRPKSQLKQ